MARVKGGPAQRARHKKVLKATRGYRLSLGKHYKVSKEAQLHADRYAYVGRRLRKRDLRRLWIERINAGLKTMQNAPSYSVFVKLLDQHQVKLNRKMLAELATTDFKAFEKVVQTVYGK